MGVNSNTEIAGKLRLVSPLGHGSAGQVWLAKHLHLGSDVAVKFLNREVSLSLTARERFVREAKTIARIRSPHVVQVHDFGFHDDCAYLVMEHLVGETLEARLARVGSLPPEQVVRVCTHIAKALQKAHDAGIIHRDIKPANVFLVDYGDEEVAKVVDFGIVKSQRGKLSTSTLETLTQAGSLLGTPYYMSPEQIEDSGHVSHQADLWALGVIAYECLLGRLPFEAPNFALLVMAVCRDPVPVPSSIASVPPAFDAWVERALHRDPEARFGSARELARELCQALLFPDASDTLSIPDGLLPPDLIWSGAFPLVKGTASGCSGSEPPVRLTSEPPGQDDPTIATRQSSPGEDIVWEEASRDLGKPEIGLRREPSERDGSLDSQISSKPPEMRPSRTRLPILLAAGVALLAFGWFASRLVHSIADPPTPQVAAPVASATPTNDTATAAIAMAPTSSLAPTAVAPRLTAVGLTPSAAASGAPSSGSRDVMRKANATAPPASATATPTPERPFDLLEERQ
jgi:serine/threonine-protein kinase